MGSEGEELDGEGHRVGAEDEAAGVEVEEAKEQCYAAADGVEGALVSPVCGEGVVVAIDDGNGSGGEERLHGGGLLGVSADGYEALQAGGFWGAVWARLS